MLMKIILKLKQEIAKEAVKIASGIDVFTDDHITTDEI